MEWTYYFLSIFISFLLSFVFSKLLITETKEKNGRVLADEISFGIVTIISFLAAIFFAILFFAKNIYMGYVFVFVWFFVCIYFAFKRKSKKQRISEFKDILRYKRVLRKQEDCQHILILAEKEKKKSKNNEPQKHICLLCGKKVYK